MELLFSPRFQKERLSLPKHVSFELDKALKFFVSDPRHPSLRAKKLPDTNYWYARIDRAYRFTYSIEGETVTLRRVGTHDILTRERHA